MGATSIQRLLAAALLFTVLVPVRGVFFSNLMRTLVVDAQIQSQNISAGVAKVGEDHLTIEWRFNSSFAKGVDVDYASVKVELCFGPVSQVNRAWRKTKNDLQRDKTCLKQIATQRYTNAGNSLVWRIPKDVPGAIYFVRAYVLDAEGTELAYGQSTDDAKTMNLIIIIPITGRHPAMDIAGVVFSLFSVASLFSFLASETYLGGRKILPRS